MALHDELGRVPTPDRTARPTRRGDEHHAAHRQVRARAEHVLAQMTTGKLMRDCRRRGAGVHLAALGIAHRHHLGWAGTSSPSPGTPTPQDRR